MCIYMVWVMIALCNKQVDQGGGQQEYAPMSNTNSSRSGAAAFCVFGGGSRLCPGYELARVELCVFLHHLLTTFRSADILFFFSFFLKK